MRPYLAVAAALLVSVAGVWPGGRAASVRAEPAARSPKRPPASQSVPAARAGGAPKPASVTNAPVPGGMVPAEERDGADQTVLEENVRPLVMSMDLRRTGGGTPEVQLVPRLLPARLTPRRVKAPADGLGEAKAKLVWNIALDFTSGNPRIALLSEEKAYRPAKGRIRVPVALRLGENRIELKTVDIKGATSDYVLKVEVKVPERVALPQTEPTAFLVAGPVVYQRLIRRGGTALLEKGTTRSLMTGIRAIYRRRILKDFTAKLPGGFKLFFDGSGTLGKTLGGDLNAQGMPLLLDGRGTVEFFAKGLFRVEGGIGMTFFMPGLSNSVPGDLQNYVGMTLSTRMGYPVASRLYLLGGFNFSFPTSAVSEKAVLVSNPIELFLAGSTPIGNRGFLELRVKYLNISTSGNASIGTIERSETLFGPELLWVWKF